MIGRRPGAAPRALVLLTLVASAACRDYSNVAKVAGPPAAIVIFGGSSQQAPAGTDLPDPLIVHVIDANALPIKGQLVAFRVNSGGGSVLAGAGTTTDLGEARERWKLGTVASDPQLVEARAVNSAGETIVTTTFTATALPGPAKQLLKVAGDNQSGAASTPVATAPVVRVADQYGNSVPNVQVTFAASAGGSVSPATQATSSTGLASTTWTLGPALGANTLTVSAAGLTTLTFTATSVSGVRRR